MTITSYSRTAQVAYQDLLRLHKDEAASVLIGSVEARHRNGRVYIYDKFRIGTQMKSRYLGEGSNELRARLANAADLKAAGEERRETMARLARVLRAEGFTATDRDTGSLLLAFARAGARVVLAARSEARLREVVEAEPGLRDRFLVVPTDVTRADEVERLFAETAAAFGGFGILVNNAGRGLRVPVARLDVAALAHEEVAQNGAVALGYRDEPPHGGLGKVPDVEGHIHDDPRFGRRHAGYLGDSARQPCRRRRASRVRGRTA